MVIIKSERFLNEDIYIDYPYEDVMFRWDHINRLRYKKWYGQEEFAEPVPHDSELYNEALRFGDEITKDLYIKGKPKMEPIELEYVGFWPRVGASLIDTILISVIIWPLLTAIYGKGYWADTSLVKGPMDFLLSYVLPSIAIVAFWVSKQATPGKMAIKAVIVDAETGEKPGTRQLIIRYLAYYPAMLPLFLGFLWVAFDSRKQGWHDKLAKTVVVRPKVRGTEAVSFKKK